MTLSESVCSHSLGFTDICYSGGRWCLHYWRTVALTAQIIIGAL